MCALPRRLRRGADLTPPACPRATADATVYSVTDAVLHRVAVKKIRQPPGEFDRFNINNVLVEVRVLRHLRSVPCVVRCLGTYVGEGGDVRDVSIVFRLSDTTLASQLSLQPAPPQARIQRLVTQLVEAVAWLHAMRVLHRDLKPANLLVDASAERLLVCDFGLARAFTESEWTAMELGESMERGLTMGLYTCDYRPPEVCLGSRYASAADVWASACVIVELMWWGKDRPRARFYDWGTEPVCSRANDVPSRGPLRALLRALRPQPTELAHLPETWRDWGIRHLESFTTPHLGMNVLRRRWGDAVLDTLASMFVIDPARRSSARQLSGCECATARAMASVPPLPKDAAEACAQLREEVAEWATLCPE